MTALRPDRGHERKTGPSTRTRRKGYSMETGRNLIVVTGATGKQGGAIARELLTKGHKVRAMTRKPDSPLRQQVARRGEGPRPGVPFVHRPAPGLLHGELLAAVVPAGYPAGAIGGGARARDRIADDRGR